MNVPSYMITPLSSYCNTLELSYTAFLQKENRRGGRGPSVPFSPFCGLTIRMVHYVYHSAKFSRCGSRKRCTRYTILCGFGVADDENGVSRAPFWRTSALRQLKTVHLVHHFVRLWLYGNFKWCTT